MDEADTACFPSDAVDAATMDTRGAQRAFSAVVDKHVFDEVLIATMTPAEAAVLRSCSGDFAGAWVTASPAAHLTCLDDDDFTIAANLRLGLPHHYPEVPPAEPPTCVKCGAANPSTGEHALRCNHT